MIIFHKNISNWFCIYQIDSVSLNLLFNLIIINILKTHDDGYICAYGAWIGKVYSQELERLIFPMQTYGKYTLNVNILK